MVKIIWTKWAIKDLKSVFDFISLDSKFYAIRFTESLIERINQLYIHTHSGRIVPEKKQSINQGVNKWQLPDNLQIK